MYNIFSKTTLIVCFLFFFFLPHANETLHRVISFSLLSRLSTWSLYIESIFKREKRRMATKKHLVALDFVVLVGNAMWLYVHVKNHAIKVFLASLFLYISFFFSFFNCLQISEAPMHSRAELDGDCGETGLRDGLNVWAIINFYIFFPLRSLRVNNNRCIVSHGGVTSIRCFNVMALNYFETGLIGGHFEL